MFSSRNLNEGDDDFAANTSENDEGENVHEEEELDDQMKTISMQEYKILMNLIPEVAKLRDQISKMTTEIQSKDSQINELQFIHQTDLSNHINVSLLTTVRI